jgi:hypothetical protein
MPEHVAVLQSKLEHWAEINDGVYRHFALTPAEIKLLQKEVEH